MFIRFSNQIGTYSPANERFARVGSSSAKRRVLCCGFPHCQIQIFMVITFHCEFQLQCHLINRRSCPHFLLNKSVRLVFFLIRCECKRSNFPPLCHCIFSICGIFSRFAASLSTRSHRTLALRFLFKRSYSSSDNEMALFGWEWVENNNVSTMHISWFHFNIHVYSIARHTNEMPFLSLSQCLVRSRTAIKQHVFIYLHDFCS